MGPLSTRVIELASGYLNDTETGNNDAPWLEQMMKNAGNPNHWVPGESYCIGALCALLDIACKELNITLPFPTSLSTRGFYEGAKAKGWTNNGPDTIVYEPGDIAIFSEGTSWQGHAALVTAVTPEGLSTIEFNTSSNLAGSQRNGTGCFAKTRLFKQFAAPSAFNLWLRGSVKTSKL